MEDIFVSAKKGNSAAIKGLYASSVSSAYSAVKAVVEDTEQAAGLVKEIYVSAFADAASYDEFFLLLNKRASSVCTLLLGKNIKIDTIAATDTAFTDLGSLEIAAELKTFDTTLSGVVTKAAQAKKSTLPAFPFKKGKGKKAPDELKQFEEMLKKQEFAHFDTYEPEKEPEPEKPKSLAEKLQGEEIVLSEEQLHLEKKEAEKNRKASIIAFIFAAVILVGAISTYFITKQIIRFNAQRATSGAVQILSEPTVDKEYNQDEADKAYRDYLNQVIIKKYGKASTENTVSYSEAGEVGAAQLNGLLSYRILDIDKDGKEELCAILSSVQSENNLYTYAYRLSLYRFVGKEVVPIQENYELIKYSTYNRAVDYNFGDFKMHIKAIHTGKKDYLYAQAGGEDMQICSFHYYDSGKLFEGERFVSFSVDEKNKIYLQRRLDGTYEPLYLRVRGAAQESTDAIHTDFEKALSEYGFSLGSKAVKCQNGKELIAYFNKAFARIGYQLNSWDMRFDTEDTADFVCDLESQTMRGDMLSYKAEVQLTDFTALDSFLEGEAPLREEAAEQEASQESAQAQEDSTAAE